MHEATVDLQAPPLDAIRAAVTAYHLALDRREQGGGAAGQALDAIEQALGMPWVQGKAAAVEQLRVAEADKRVCNARARVALLGGTLHIIDDDRGRPVFIVSRWALTKELPDIEAVETWLAQAEPKG